MTVLLVSAHSFSQSVATSNTEMNGIKFRTCSYEFSSNEFSKKIDFTLPLPSENAVLQTICEALLMGEYDNNTLEQDLKNELASYNADSDLDTTKAEDYSETSWSITPRIHCFRVVVFAEVCKRRGSCTYVGRQMCRL